MRFEYTDDGVEGKSCCEHTINKQT
jgi:hypothetical protein